MVYPTTPDVSISPSAPFTGDQLTVSIDTPSTDPDGDPISYSYEWQLGGVTQAAYTTSTLPSSATNKGEQWTVMVTPTDGNYGRRCWSRCCHDPKYAAIYQSCFDHWELVQ